MSIDREFLSQVVIVLAVCAGAWLMLVQPKAQQLGRLERELADSAAASGLSSQDGIETLAARFDSHKQDLAVIRRRNAEAEDTSSLYASIMRLAAEHSVRVQAIQPTPARQASAKPEAVRAARLEMTVTGEFASIAKFLDRVTAIDAYIRPSSLQMIPVDGADQSFVSARFTCDVLAFTIDSVLAGVGDTNNAQP